MLLQQIVNSKLYNKYEQPRTRTLILMVPISRDNVVSRNWDH